MFDRSLSLILALAALGAAGCEVAPVAIAQAPAPAPPVLGFRQVVQPQPVTLAGTVRAPGHLISEKSSLLAGLTPGESPRLNEQPVGGASVTVHAPDGQPLLGGAAVRTDTHGRFALRGFEATGPFLVRATFQQANGRTRTLQALVAPSVRCVGVDLASSLVAARMRAEGGTTEAADQLDDVVKATRAQLPAILDARNGHAPAADGETATLIDDLTTGESEKNGRAASTIFADAPALENTWQATVGATLEVKFTIQSLGENQADILTPTRLQKPLRGEIELVCKTGSQPVAGVRFYLNNEPIAEAKDAEGAWVARLDTRDRADGAYVLTALAENPSDDAPLQARALVRIDNTSVEEAGPCGN